MAKDKKDENKAAPSASSGARKTAKRNRELRRCRKALKHHQKRGWNSEALEQHLKSVTAGTPQVPNEGKRQRRAQHETKERAKRDTTAAAAQARWARENPGLAADIASVQGAARGG